jgi:hypothetical protein
MVAVVVATADAPYESAMVVLRVRLPAGSTATTSGDIDAPDSVRGVAAVVEVQISAVIA